ncbi:flagellar basal body P-ring formation chaperone FlgA [Cereibacter sphaeroides]|uniref:flagellar basal body P-ring formation chaperone FlgA n=1 Tax=Cereibacter sphaeroides TaxID=1063 RepID=UPI001F1D9064|nr:flagellar basal body P-ring formation chaperone FlgA [Cereibacter sphaeroides]MCE6961941.1 flagellar basal body P-ring formation chaperone FlgA [Cereibacter sphaeroides]MCE6970716.1 flagellar basal body P-ring formation chaperone FlgA [Cereibacter sphaeroides]MCE6975688.1 flagellar basal body P-ring formation chaperone FlgA [Cereibacter sphaeroides]
MKALVLAGLLALPAAAAEHGLSGAEAAGLIASAMARAGVPGEPPAPLRPLPPCSHEPHVGPLNGSWSTAELRCEAPEWKRALRTKAPARHDPRKPRDVPDEATAVVLARPVPRGAALAPADLAPVEGAMQARTEALVGRRLRVALAPGQPVLPRHLEPDRLVTRGEPMALRVVMGGIEVLAPGEALSDAGFGDLVEVRNLSSGITVKATVTARNMAEVRPNMR